MRAVYFTGITHVIGYCYMHYYYYKKKKSSIARRFR